MARHWEWARFRFVGDPVLCQQYMGEGRKYLGELEDQMKHGVIPSNSRRVTNAAGVVFIVAVLMGYPIITIDVTSANPKQVTTPTLQGFVIKPTDESVAFVPASGHDEVVLDPTTQWKTWVYDGTHLDSTVHDHVTPKRLGGFYSPTFPVKLTGLTDPGGLPYSGNIDWRSADQSRLVSWYGPRNRYFNLVKMAGPPGSGISSIDDREPWVFFKGRVLLDISEHESALFSTTGTYISGACLRVEDDGTLTLLTVCSYRTPDHSGSTPTLFRDWVVSAKVKGYPIDRTLTLDASSLHVLASRDLEWITVGSTWSLNEPDTGHPWFWNSDGTEARCIRSYQDGTFDGSGNQNVWVRELILSTPKTGATTFANVDDLLPLTITTTTGNGTFTTPVATAHLNRVDLLLNTSGYTTTDTSIDGFVGVCDPRYGLALDYTVVESVTRDKYKVAVDYRDNVPVYAYTIPYSRTTTTRDQLLGYSSSYTDSIGGIASTWTNTGSPATSYYVWQATCQATFAENIHRLWTQNVTETAGGVETDFVTVDGLNNTGDYSMDLTFSKSFSASVTGVSNHVTSPGPYHLRASELCAAFDNNLTLNSYTNTMSANGTTSEATTEYSITALMYLDLRYKSVVYFADYTGDTKSTPFSNTYSPAAILTNASGGGTILSGFSYSLPWTNAHGAAGYTYNVASGTRTDSPVTYYKQSVTMNAAEVVVDTTSYIPPNDSGPVSIGLGLGPTDGSNKFIDDTAQMAEAYNLYAFANYAWFGGGSTGSTTGPPYFDRVATSFPYSSNPGYVSGMTTIPPNFPVNTSSTTTRRAVWQPPMLDMATALQGTPNTVYMYRDNATYLHYGSWANYKGQWAYSSTWLTPGSSWVTLSRKSQYSADDGSVNNILGAPDYDKIFWPIWVLPSTSLRA